MDLGLHQGESEVGCSEAEARWGGAWLGRARTPTMREARRPATSRPHTMSCCQMWWCRTQRRGPAGVLARAGGAPSPGAWSLRPRGLHGIRTWQPWGPRRFPRSGEAQRQALLGTPRPPAEWGLWGQCLRWTLQPGPTEPCPAPKHPPPECGGSGEGPRFTL